MFKIDWWSLFIILCHLMTFCMMVSVIYNLWLITMNPLPIMLEDRPLTLNKPGTHPHERAQIILINNEYIIVFYSFTCANHLISFKRKIARIFFYFYFSLTGKHFVKNKKDLKQWDCFIVNPTISQFSVDGLDPSSELLYITAGMHNRRYPGHTNTTFNIIITFRKFLLVNLSPPSFEFLVAAYATLYWSIKHFKNFEIIFKIS